MKVTKNQFKFSEGIENYQDLRNLYNLQLAYIRKRGIHFTFVYVKYSEESAVSYEEFYRLVEGNLRKSDFVFTHQSKQYVILVLSISKEMESKSFLSRLQTSMNPLNMPLVAVIAEIANSTHSLEEILEAGESKVMDLDFSHTQMVAIPYFLEKERIKMKVSIVENDHITQSIFSNLFHNLETEEQNLEVRVFNDGLEFIESDWYRSEHPHIVVLNDILPRKNGFEVLHYLRGLPNEQKYLILFISTRNSEEAQLYCLENGADAYFVRPFNLKILEIRIKNHLRRLH
ncbi:response regulator transcription factor [Solibacillus sp. FSL K6-4121]|uniref:response regulator transcription factor n=1 Tax=Solibacillus sp. FSL K6-4121 TaxID=2921505 RepID=UPI0030F7C56A